MNSWFARQFEGRLGGAPRLARVADGAFTDTKAPWISLGGTASVARFGEATGTRPDARRFRLNIMMETSTPFEEAALVGEPPSAWRGGDEGGGPGRTLRRHRCRPGHRHSRATLPALDGA